MKFNILHVIHVQMQVYGVYMYVLHLCVLCDVVVNTHSHSQGAQTWKCGHNVHPIQSCMMLYTLQVNLE